MLQRVLRLLAPLGAGKRALARALRRRPSRVAARRAEDLVSYLVGADGGQTSLAERCRAVLRQSWRPLEVLVAGEPEALRPLASIRGVRLLSWHGEQPDTVERELRQLAGDYVFTGEGETDPGLLADMVAALLADPLCDEVRGDGRTVAARGSWRLERNRPAAATTTMPVYEAASLDPFAPLPAEPDRPFALRFGGEPDLPYRFRAWLAEPRCHAVTSDLHTADRLALLTRRCTHDPDPTVALARSSASAAVRASRPRLWPLRALVRPHVVLQVDDFAEGGMEQVVIDLADALHQEGFTTSLLILGKEGSAGQRARARGLTVGRLARDASGYADYLRHHRTALVNAHYSTFGAETCAGLGIPFVHTLHNMFLWFGPKMAEAYRAADRHTQAYVCVSNNVARYADLRLGLSPSRMLVIPNGCDRAFRPTAEHRAAAIGLRRELGLSSDARVFLNVGSVQPLKGQHLLLGALQRIAAAAPDAHLVVLGGIADRGYEREQRALAKRLGLADRVHWVGRRTDVSAFHQLACAMVQPSFFEGWSLAITEAVLAALPVIATDVGGACEQLRGTDGIVLPAAVPDITAVDRDRLAPLLRAPCRDLQERLATAMLEMLARDGRRSRMPQDWQALLRETAYRHCAEVFHWLAAGGSAAAARHWLWAETDGPRGGA